MFDTNNGNDLWGYGLNLKGSMSDLKKIEEKICNGMRVIIYMPDELEMEAELKFDDDVGYWKAIPIEGTTKYLSTSADKQ